MTKHSYGFTVIEILLVVVILGVASILFFTQKNNIEVVARDNDRKTAINAMYYGLEEVFYQDNKYYPQTLSSDNLRSIDPALFIDPSGTELGDTGSDYTYSPTNCTDGKCKSYTLQTILENEDDYIKTSRNN